jgi:sialate O-acetylesterase
MGLISSNWGGTPVETWISRDALETKLPVVLEQEKKYLEVDYPRLLAEYEAKQKEYEANNAKQGDPTTRPMQRPNRPRGPMNQNSPTTLFNGMIAPIVKYPIKGAIWYQGESNAGQGYAYAERLTAMIEDWRAKWGQGDFPFLIVQLANYMAPPKTPVEDVGWPRLRQAQVNVAKSVPNTGVAVIIDIGEEKDIHPRNKQDVGRRLALVARKVAYGEANVVYSGPAMKSVGYDGAKAVISYDHVGAGLKAKDEKLPGFAIKGDDGQWHAADAKIVGDTIELTAPDVKSAKGAAYAWANNPPAPLYNAEGLPAVPFKDEPGAATK